MTFHRVDDRWAAQCFDCGCPYDRRSGHWNRAMLLRKRTKTEPHIVVLSTAAQDVLRGALAASTSEWVFPSPAGGPFHRATVSRVFKRTARAAGLSDFHFHFHDLRHHGAMRALNAGLSQSVVMALGGWQSERMLRRYAKMTDRVLRAAAEVVSGRAITPHQVATERAAEAWETARRDA